MKKTRKERVELIKNMKFAHFNFGDGHATVAGAFDNNDFYYGVSFCSPDDIFSKTKGRYVAISKLSSYLNGKKETRTGVISGCNTFELHALLLNAAKSAFNNQPFKQSWTYGITANDFKFRGKRTNNE